MTQPAAPRETAAAPVSRRSLCFAVLAVATFALVPALALVPLFARPRDVPDQPAVDPLRPRQAVFRSMQPNETAAVATPGAADVSLVAAGAAAREAAREAAPTASPRDAGRALGARPPPNAGHPSDAARPVLQGDASCVSGVAGRHFVADDRGRHCPRLARVPGTDCCDTAAPETRRYLCGGCDPSQRCCSEYEACVSCCQLPAHGVRAGEGGSPVHGDGRETTAAADRSPFDACRRLCLSHGAVLRHENRYRSLLHHCFVAPPPYSALIPVLAARGQSCDDACGALPANASSPSGRASPTSDKAVLRSAVLLAPGVPADLARQVIIHTGAAATRRLLAQTPPPSARPRPFAQATTPRSQGRPPSRLRGDPAADPAAAAAAASGPAAYGKRGGGHATRPHGPSLVCEPRFFGQVNTCEAMAAGLPCASCSASHGADQPALVSPQAPARAKPMACLRTSDAALLGCAGSHPDTHRLCPCRSPLV